MKQIHVVQSAKKSDHTAVKSELRLTFILRQMDALEETFKKNFLVISDEMQAAKDWKFRNANRIAVLQGNLPKDQQEETEFDEPQLPIEVIVNGRFYSVRGGQGDEIEEITINIKNKN